MRVFKGVGLTSKANALPPVATRRAPRELPGAPWKATSVRQMSALEPPDSHHLNAAAGWLELGLPEEAQAELNRLTPGARQLPEALAVEWDLHARGACWERALDVASRLLACDRSKPAGWINRSYALHELRRTAEARDFLLPAVTLFPAIGVIPYNLACYTCQLGELDDARRWLRHAMEVDGRECVLGRARTDADLTPLRGELDRI